MACDHVLYEQETACEADGLCPICLHKELLLTRGLLLASYQFVSEDKVLKRLIWETVVADEKTNS